MHQRSQVKRFYEVSYFKIYFKKRCYLNSNVFFCPKIMKNYILFLLIGFTSVVFSQESDSSLSLYRYENDYLTKEFHQERRTALRAEMPENSVAVIFANPIRNRSNDVDFEYHQDPNFYYLSGFLEPNAMLLVFKNQIDFNGEKTDEILLIQERDISREIWDGRRLGPERAESFLGIKTVKPNKEIENLKLNWKGFNEILYIDLNAKKYDQSANNRDLESLKTHFEAQIKVRGVKSNADKLAEIMARLRQLKLKEELILMQKAIDITCEAQIELMKALKSGMTEYQSEAVIEYVFKKKGAEYPGFPSIVGGGENSCVLHYVSNRKSLENNNLLVSDVGAEFHGYTADVTRTIPVDGSYSIEEKAIYDLVLKAQNAGIRECKVGNAFRAPHNAATEIIADGLVKLGIIKDRKEVRKYFMHGTSHYLGLDVHDWGTYENLVVGNVITVEPGIYIAAGSDCDPKWWNIGVRIEDDILITDNEPINMSEKAPRTTEDIEEMMKKDSSF